MLSTCVTDNIHPKCVGAPFPSFKDLYRQFNLVEHTNPLEGMDGTKWIIQVWKRRSLNELNLMAQYEEIKEDETLREEFFRQRETKKEKRKKDQQANKYDRIIDARTG